MFIICGDNSVSDVKKGSLQHKVKHRKDKHDVLYVLDTRRSKNEMRGTCSRRVAIVH